jgi:sarcosine oxidase, subunit delta
MKVIDCPIIGERPLQEFAYGGQVRTFVDPEQLSDEQWTDYLFNRQGGPGIVLEWWHHLPSGTWFVAERDNVADEIIRTYLYGAGREDE